METNALYTDKLKKGMFTENVEETQLKITFKDDTVFMICQWSSGD